MGRPIEERPADAENRGVAGHLEGDLILGGKTSQAATLVCRKTRHLTMVQPADRPAETLADALTRRYAEMPAEMKRTLTWDRGMEMA